MGQKVLWRFTAVNMATLATLYEHTTYTKTKPMNSIKHHYAMLGEAVAEYVRFLKVLPPKIRRAIPSGTLDRQFLHVRPDDLTDLCSTCDVLAHRLKMLGRYKGTELDLFQASALAQLAKVRVGGIKVFDNKALATWFGVSPQTIKLLARDYELPVIHATLFDLTTSFKELGTVSAPTALRERYITLLKSELNHC